MAQQNVFIQTAHKQTNHLTCGGPTSKKQTVRSQHYPRPSARESTQTPKLLQFPHCAVHSVPSHPAKSGRRRALADDHHRAVRIYLPRRTIILAGLQILGEGKRSGLLPCSAVRRPAPSELASHGLGGRRRQRLSECARGIYR